MEELKPFLLKVVNAVLPLSFQGIRGYDQQAEITESELLFI
jgi:hypothetical protein